MNCLMCICAMEPWQVMFCCKFKGHFSYGNRDMCICKRAPLSASHYCCELTFTCSSNRHKAAHIYTLMTLNIMLGSQQTMHGPFLIRVSYWKLGKNRTCKMYVKRSEEISEEMLFMDLWIFAIWCMFAVMQDGQ